MPEPDRRNAAQMPMPRSKPMPMPMPIAAAGTQWRVRVIAAWPIASTADTDGLQAQSIAQESLTKTCVVTACLDPRSMHSYISRDLALFMLGPDGLRLAEAAAHKSILGQVGLSMATEEEMTAQWTESFLLGDNCDLDLVMSPWTWNSLRQQEASCLGRWIHKSLSCSFLDDGRSIPGEYSSSYTTLLAQDEEDLYPTQPSEPSSTPHSCRSPTLSQARPKASDKSHSCNLANSCNSGFSVDSPRQVERKDLGEVAPRHCAEVARGKVWAWDAQQQNYFARNRSKDDSWYWYPREIV